MFRTWRVWLGLATFLGLMRNAGAQDLAKAKVRRVAPPVVRLWASFPVSHLTIPVGVMVSGVSAQLTLREFWTVEAGAAAVLTGPTGPAPDYFVRAGVTPVIGDERDATGRGWTAQLVMMAGEWYVERFTNPDGHFGSEETHALRGNAAVDFTKHGRDMKYAIDLGVDFGLGF
ncbi:MAG: hypothetical protein QM756_09870 [Polyangiaceae bacterium]